MLMNPQYVEPNVRTRDGGQVILLAHFDDQERVYIGVRRSQDCWVECSWNKDGTYLDKNKTCGLDLIITAGGTLPRRAA